MGLILCGLGICVTLTGYHFGKKISPFHVIIYFMASFVFLAGALLVFLYDEPAVFEI